MKTLNDLPEFQIPRFTKDEVVQLQKNQKYQPITESQHLIDLLDLHISHSVYVSGLRAAGVTQKFSPDFYHEYGGREIFEKAEKYFQEKGFKTSIEEQKLENSPYWVVTLYVFW